MLSTDGRVEASCSGWRGWLRKRAYYTSLTQREDGLWMLVIRNSFPQRPLCTLEDAIAIEKVFEVAGLTRRCISLENHIVVIQPHGVALEYKAHARQNDVRVRCWARLAWLLRARHTTSNGLGSVE
jgi:hypothetical protein